MSGQRNGLRGDRLDRADEGGFARMDKARAPGRADGLVQRKASREVEAPMLEGRRGLTIDAFSVADTAPAVQLQAFDSAVARTHEAVADADGGLFGGRSGRASRTAFDGPASADTFDLMGGARSSPIQMKTDGHTGRDTDDIQSAAAHGTRGGGGKLPYFERIQAAFGNHDISGIRSHVGGAAREASDAIGAEAYATGSSVAFRSAPSLHTAAHEAAHIVQQRAGVSLKGGVGESGDRYERHADAVADAVVSGKSAEGLLGPVRSGGLAGVQRAATEPVYQRTIKAIQNEKNENFLVYQFANLFSQMKNAKAKFATLPPDVQNKWHQLRPDQRTQTTYNNCIETGVPPSPATTTPSPPPQNPSTPPQNPATLGGLTINPGDLGAPFKSTPNTETKSTEQNNPSRQNQQVKQSNTSNQSSTSNQSRTSNQSSKSNTTAWCKDLATFVQRGAADDIIALISEHPTEQYAIESALIERLATIQRPDLLAELNRKSSSKAVRLKTLDIYKSRFYGTVPKYDSYFREKYPDHHLTEGLDYLYALVPTAETDLTKLRSDMERAQEPKLRELARTKYIEAAKAHIEIAETVDELLDTNPDQKIVELKQPIQKRFIKALASKHLERAPEVGLTHSDVLQKANMPHDELLKLFHRTPNGAVKNIIADQYVRAVQIKAPWASATELARMYRSNIPGAAEVAKRAFTERFGKNEAYADLRPAFGLSPLPGAEKPSQPSTTTKGSTAKVPEGGGARVPSSGRRQTPTPETSSEITLSPDQIAAANEEYSNYLQKDGDKPLREFGNTTIDRLGDGIAQWIETLVGDRKVSLKGSLSAEIATQIPGVKVTTGASISAGYKGGKFVLSGSWKLGVAGKFDAIICEAIAEISAAFDIEVEATDPSAAVRVMLLAFKRRIEAISPEAAVRIFGEGDRSGGIGKNDKATLSTGLEGKLEASSGDSKGAITGSIKREYETSGENLDSGESVKDTTELGFEAEGGLISSKAKIKWVRGTEGDELTLSSTGTFPFADSKAIGLIAGKIAEIAQKGGNRAQAIRDLAHEFLIKANTVLAAAKGKAKGEIELATELKWAKGKVTGTISLSNTTTADVTTPKLVPFAEVEGEGKIASKIIELNFE